MNEQTKKDLLPYKYPRPLPREHALSIFVMHEIINELLVILDFINLEHQPPVELEEQQWSEFINNFVSCFGSLPAKTGDVEHALRGEDRQLVALLGQRILKSIDALYRIPDMLGARFQDEAVLLLPTTYAQRLDMLIGEGRIPVAQITQFDVLRF